MPRKRELSREQDQEICVRYLNGDTCQLLADKFQVSISTVCNRLKEHGIARIVHFHNLSADAIEEIHRRHSLGESSYALATAFGVSRPAICAHLRNAGKQTRTRSEANTRYQCNHSFFSQINSEEKAYALGFIVTDGCILHNTILSITLNGCDFDHLLKIAHALSSTRPVRKYAHKNYELCQLNIRSDQLVTDLAQYGVVSRKTFTVGWPDLPEHLYRHFLRGAFDGDGSFGAYRSGRQKTNHFSIRFTGNQNLAPACLKHISQQCKVPMISLGTRLNNDGSFSSHSFAYSGNRRCIPILNLLYEDATIYLPRKRDIILNHYRRLPKYRDQLRFG